jgi:hypothetical protein
MYIYAWIIFVLAGTSKTSLEMFGGIEETFAFFGERVLIFKLIEFRAIEHKRRISRNSRAERKLNNNTFN